MTENHGGGELVNQKQKFLPVLGHVNYIEMESMGKSQLNLILE